MLPDVQWDIIVVPNGCKDDTHAQAEQALQAACANSTTAGVSWRVISLERAGKSHPWNLHAMVITDGFRQYPDYSRVVRADNASHYYEGLNRVRDIVNHEVRVTIGTVLNAFLCWDVLLFMTPRDGPGAGEIVRVLTAQDPSWYRRMMANQIAIRGLWAIRTTQLWRRLPGWWALPPAKRVVKLPTTLALSLFDAGDVAGQPPARLRARGGLLVRVG